MNALAPAAPRAVALAGDLASAKAYARADKSEATRRAYRSDFADFTAWCADRGAEPLPASIETVAAYLAALADRKLTVSTITRRCAAIRYAHRLAGLEPPTSAEAVRAVLRGIRRTLGVRARQKSPITAKALARILKRIAGDRPDALRDRALLLIGFAAALRRSEIAALEVAHLERATGGIIVHIPRSKTDQDGRGQSVAVLTGRKLRPVEALDAWLAASRIESGPVFRPLRRGGHLVAGMAPLSDHAIAIIIKRRASAAGFTADDIGGHSLRAGFVTSALEDGADVLKVMDVTRHRSVETLKVYDRRAKLFTDHAGKGFL